MDKTKKWRKILAMMLTIVMMLQNVQSVVWATGTENSTQETTVEKKSDAENNETATDEEQTKEEASDKSSEELTDSEEKNTGFRNFRTKMCRKSGCLSFAHQTIIFLQ